MYTKIRFAKGALHPLPRQEGMGRYKTEVQHSGFQGMREEGWEAFRSNWL